jgi:hypothetical protein
MRIASGVSISAFVKLCVSCTAPLKLFADDEAREVADDEQR